MVKIFLKHPEKYNKFLIRIFNNLDNKLKNYSHLTGIAYDIFIRKINKNKKLKKKFSNLY
jgi:hypothetical protein|tara:strand:- start:758 stop:937 length:180 start_codon:yes stop_codon:yes gene_type:complete